MVSKFQWKPFWLATQRDPQNDWTATQNRVNYDVFAQAPSIQILFCSKMVTNRALKQYSEEDSGDNGGRQIIPDRNSVTKERGLLARWGAKWELQRVPSTQGRQFIVHSLRKVANSKLLIEGPGRDSVHGGSLKIAWTLCLERQISFSFDAVELERDE